MLASYGGMTPPAREQADLALWGWQMCLWILYRVASVICIRGRYPYSKCLPAPSSGVGNACWGLRVTCNRAPVDDALEIPAPVRDLLRQCLRQDPAARPHDMNAPWTAFEIYGNLAVGPIRVKCPCLPGMADVLNNKALRIWAAKNAGTGPKPYGAGLPLMRTTLRPPTT